MTLTLENWFDDRSSLQRGEWAKLARPQMHCEGWGRPSMHSNRGSDNASVHCDGGTGLWASRRARWVRWDGALQCGTCKRADVKRVGDSDA